MPYVFDSYGNLNGGIIESNLSDLQSNLVDDFKSSVTRKRNFDSFLELVRTIKGQGVQDGVSKIWIDGSFCTMKVDPNDIDLIILLKPFNDSAMTLEHNFKLIRDFFIPKHLDIYMTYDSNYLKDHDYIEQLLLSFKKTNASEFSEKEITEMLSDNHKEMDHQMKYWMGQFGFDRQQRNKGLISLEGGNL